MRLAGIICEYNPFHNGHKLHIEKTREITRCDYVITAMSGSFTQRGDPAIADKWTRAEMALRNGADVVAELPAAFAVRPADKFALGGVSMLSQMGCKWLSFGCETDDADIIKRLASQIIDESPDFKELIRRGLEKGYSHARARGLALCETAKVEPEFLNMPNLSLAIEYAAANARLGSPMELIAIKRLGGYHDDEISDVCSASAIRKAVSESGDYARAMPESAFKLLNALLPNRVSDVEALDGLALYNARNASNELLKSLPDQSEGAYMLIKKRALTAYSRADMLNKAKCKRYTLTRLNRMITYMTLGLDSGRLNAIDKPPYARILGFRRSAMPLMRFLKENSAVPVITDPVKLKKYDCFAIENEFTDLWALSTRDPDTRRSGLDYTKRVVIVD